jgi:hypothetical protein
MPRQVLLSLNSILLGLIVGWSCFLVLEGMQQHSTTFDEPFHLSWSDRLLQESVASRAEVMNWHSTTPITQLNVLSARWIGPYFNSKHRQFITRLPQMLWYLITLSMIWLIANRLAGQGAANLALLMTALDVQIQGHSSLATTDAALVALIVATLFLLLRWLEKPGFTRAIILGFSVGVLLITKAAAALMLPVLFIAGIFVIVRSIRSRAPNLTHLTNILAQIFIAIIVSLIVIAFSYHFIGLFVALKDIPLYSELFKYFATLWPNLRLPLPASHIEMFDTCLSLNNQQQWMVIVLNRWFPHGVWYYFPLVWLYKTPLFILIFTLLGLALAFKNARAIWRSPAALLVLLQSAIFLVYFLVFFKTQVGYRYLLMLNPLLYLCAAIGLSTVIKEYWLRGLQVLVFIGTLIEVVPFRGNLIAFSNSLIFNKAQAYHYLTDSNLNWGQVSLDKIKASIKGTPFENAPINPPHIQPGKNIFDSNTLSGVWRNFEQHAWLRSNIKPLAHSHFVYMLYDISNEEFESFINETRSLKGQPLESLNCTEVLKLNSSDNKIVPLKKGKNVFCLQVLDSLWLLTQSPSSEVSLDISDRSWGLLKQGEKHWFKLATGLYSITADASHAASILTLRSSIELSTLINEVNTNSSDE